MKKSKTNPPGKKTAPSRLQKKAVATSVSRNRSAADDPRFAAFVNHLPGCAWMKDLHGRYVYANSALQSIEPYGAECIGMTDADLLPKEIAEIYRASDQKVISDRKPLETLEPFLVNGERHFFLVSKFPIFDKSGVAIMVGGSSIDISEITKSEERLREYERVVEGTEEMIAIVDRDYRYLLANKAFLRHRSMLASEVIGHFIWEVLPADLFEATVQPKLDQAFAGNERFVHLIFSS